MTLTKQYVSHIGRMEEIIGLPPTRLHSQISRPHDGDCDIDFVC